MPNFLEAKTNTVYTREALIPKGLPVDDWTVMRKAGYFPLVYQHRTVDKWTQREEPLPIEFNETDQTYYQRYSAVTLDTDTLARNLQHLKRRAIEAINSNTSNKILAGFVYPTELPVFISYDEFDQINFINTSYQFSTNQITTINWKSYTDASKEEAVVLTLSKDEFFELYNYALVNKNDILSVGETRKAEVKSITSISELRTYCANNNIDIEGENN